MNRKSATGVQFAVILLLVPMIAQAKSEYSACMEAQQHLGPSVAGSGATRSFGAIRATSGSYYSSGFAGSGYLASSPSISMSIVSATLHANRVSAMARHCRQFRQTKAPRFRVVGIKSHSLRPAVNGKR